MTDNGSIQGLQVVPLTTHEDVRGSLTELYREEWPSCCQVLQFNLLRSRPTTLRGMHVHAKRDDYILILDGRALLGLSDARAASPTFGNTLVLDLSGDELRGVVVPIGVLHGVYSLTNTSMLYGLSEAWDPLDESGCRWDDPGLSLPWKVDEALLSDRDAQLGTYSELCRSFNHSV